MIEVQEQQEEVQNSSTIESFLLRRKWIFLSEFSLLGFICWIGIIINERILALLVFLGGILLIVFFANQIVSRFKNNEWVIQVVFENILFFSGSRKKLSPLIKKWFEGIRRFSIVIFLLTSFIFISINGEKLIHGISSLYHSNFDTKEYLSFTSIQGGDFLILLYIAILAVILSQKIPFLLRIWKNNAGVMLAAFMTSMYPMMVFIIKPSQQAFAQPTEWLLILWGCGTVISQLFWTVQASSRKLPTHGINERSFVENYTIESLHSTDTKSDVEIYSVYSNWLSIIQEAPEFLRNKIPYMIDTPIATSKTDVLGLGKIAEDIFQYIINIELPSNASAVVIGIDGPRGSGKTSVTNILRNDYLGYARDQILTFEFRAWSYPKGDMIENFLKDLGKFCEANDIRIERELKYYIDSIQKSHIALGFLSLFFGSGKTDSERMTQISSSIRDSGKKIVILIDDVDRISNSEDIEALLKLLRSTANFYGIFYVLNYSKQEFLGKSNADYIGALNDFEEKFLNWRIEMPKMAIMRGGKSNEGKYLQEMLTEEIRRTGRIVIELLKKNESEFLYREYEDLKSLAKNTIWTSPYIEESFLLFIEEYNTNILKYLEISLISCVKSLSIPGCNTITDDGEEIVDIESIHTINTPRKVKYIINETLRLLSIENLLFEDFFADITKYMHRYSTVAGGTHKTAKAAISIELIPNPTAFGKHLKEKLLSNKL